MNDEQKPFEKVFEKKNPYVGVAGSICRCIAGWHGNFYRILCIKEKLTQNKRKAKL